MLHPNDRTDLLNCLHYIVISITGVGTPEDRLEMRWGFFQGDKGKTKKKPPGLAQDSGYFG